MRANRIVIVVVALVAAGGFVLAGEASGRWDLSGTQTNVTAYGKWICSFVPRNVELSSYYYNCEGIWDPTGGGYFFWVTQATDFTGQCDRTGPNSFKCSQIAYGANDLFEVQLIYVTYENRERLPDGTMMFKIDFCVYGPGQDPFGEDYPAIGCWYGTSGPAAPNQLVVRDAPVTN
jgi:hypothetical protein